ncbi:MAG: glycosyltransferase family 9 protein [Gemmataceae bacterium]
MRIAIIKPSALGDIVHALPVLSALRDRYPDAHIAWVVNRSFEGLLRGHPALNDIIPFDRGGAGKGIVTGTKYALAFGRTLRRHRFDWAIDLQGLLRTGLMTAATGAKRKIGFSNAREGSRHFYNERVAISAEDASRLHAVDRYWRLVEYLDAAQRPKRFDLPIDPAERDTVERELKDAPRPWYAVAVGAKWLTKRWPPERFGELLSRATREYGGTAVFVGVSEDSPLSQRAMESLAGQGRDWCGKTSLAKLAAFLSLADVAIANDTGPLHLAAAIGTPCVAPYTCTKVALHGPYTSPRGGIETTVSCAGSYLKQCPNGTICFQELTADKLWPPLVEVMNAWRTRFPSA